MLAIVGKSKANGTKLDCEQCHVNPYLPNVCQTALDVCSKYVPSNLPDAVVLHKTTEMKVASLI
jgi:hypothetical protein